MRIVIQCANKKLDGPQGSGLRHPCDNRPIVFVARPELAPQGTGIAYARPDDPCDGARLWRQVVLDYNRKPISNPARLLEAHALYKAPAYGSLVRRFGVDKVFILSAGWGLIPGSFLTPKYDITFNPTASPYAKRAKSDMGFADFQLIPDDGEEIVFLGGKDYLPMFCDLTRRLRATKRVFFNSVEELELGPGFVSQNFGRPRQRTNWHYTCAQMLADGELY